MALSKGDICVLIFYLLNVLIAITIASFIFIGSLNIKMIKESDEPKAVLSILMYGLMMLVIFFTNLQKMKEEKEKISKKSDHKFLFEGRIKRSLKLALSNNFNMVNQLFNLYREKNAPFTAKDARIVLGVSIENIRKTLLEDEFKIIFPEIDNYYHVSFDQKLYDEILKEIGHY